MSDPLKYTAFLATLRSLPLMYASAKLDFVILVSTSILSGIAPAVWIYCTKLVVDMIAEDNTPSSPLEQPIFFVWALAFLLPRIASPVMEYYQANLAEKFTAYINLSLIDKSAQLKGLSHLDNENYYNCIKTLEEGAKTRPVNIVSTVFFLMRDTITVAAICLVLASITWWMPIIFLLGLYPSIVTSLQFRELAWKAVLGRSTQAREMEYVSSMALNASYSLESRIYAYFGWLKARYLKIFVQTHSELRAVRRKTTLGILPIELFSVACILLMLYWSLDSIHKGVLTVGVIVSLLQSLAMGHQALFALVEAITILFERGLFFKMFFDFLQTDDSVRSGNIIVDIPHVVRFKNVSFTYPNGFQAVKSVSFEIRRGERIAIVGANGSGKSTIIKLLLRLYDPTTGHIEVDDHNLCAIDIDSWRAGFGVVFQDVVRYAFTVGENVRLSQTERADPGDAACRKALENAGLGDLTFKPFESPNLRLGREFNGSELSGGQWQKLSIARAFYRQPHMLVLDEPSAALDPKSEALFFDSLKKLAKGKTAVFITHRLGAVRLADRIIVMHNGEVVEAGTHDALLQLRGEYASLWHAQVSQFNFQRSAT